jgi:hypothetical protein
METDKVRFTTFIVAAIIHTSLLFIIGCGTYRSSGLQLQAIRFCRMPLRAPAVSALRLLENYFTAEQINLICDYLCFAPAHPVCPGCVSSS